MDLKGKVAIVTGASSGIGLALAEELTENSVEVALVARSKGRLHKLSKRLTKSIPIVADMAKKGDVEGMVKKVLKQYGRVDILVNNAGVGYDASIEQTNIETLNKIFELDLVAPVVAMQRVIPLMRKQGGGVIMNISSGTALMQLPNMGAYSALKRALAQISLTARLELKKDNISVGVVYPYITDTDFEKNTIKEKDVVWEGGGRSIRPPDTAEYIAKRIVEGIEKESAEVYAHDWMKKM